MKANELRIGNLVTNEWYESFKDIIIVESINKNGINLFIEDDGKWAEISQRWISPEINFEELRPIPLTEEWLLKMGAIEMVKLSDGYVRFDINGIRLSISPDDRDFFIEYVHQIPMKHVHTFQNYYFAVKGEELTIKS